MTSLDEAQKTTVRQWIQDGLKVAEIQNKLDEVFNISMTYMEVRFLVDDLGLLPKDPEPEPSRDAAPAETEAPEPAETEEPEQELLNPDEEFPAPGGKVRISIDQLARPGMLVSGKVTFNDGQNAAWYLDQFGQLGLSPEKEGYKPAQHDLMEFQMALQTELSRKGF